MNQNTSFCSYHSLQGYLEWSLFLESHMIESFVFLFAKLWTVAKATFSAWQASRQLRRDSAGSNFSSLTHCSCYRNWLHISCTLMHRMFHMFEPPNKYILCSTLETTIQQPPPLKPWSLKSHQLWNLERGEMAALTRMVVFQPVDFFQLDDESRKKKKVGGGELRWASSNPHKCASSTADTYFGVNILEFGC